MSYILIVKRSEHIMDLALYKINILLLLLHAAGNKTVHKYGLGIVHNCQHFLNSTESTNS